MSLDIEAQDFENVSREELLIFAQKQQARNARITFALEATEVGIWEWDTHFDEIFISSECYTLLGYYQGDMMMSYGDFIDKIHEDDRHKMDNVIEDHLNAYPQNVEVELRLLNKAGEYIWVRMMGKLKIKPTKGEAPVIVGTIDNISGRKRLEKELIRYQKHLESLVDERTNEIEHQNILFKERERAYSTLLENMQGMAYRYRNDGHWTMLYVSEGCMELTGFPVERLKNGAIKMEEHILHKEYVESVWEHITEALDQKKSFKVTYPIYTKDKETKWVLDRGVGVYDSNGQLINLEGVIVDITEQKKQELQYKFAQITIDNAPIAIQWIKEDGSYYYTNEATKAYSGLTAEDYSKLKIYDIDPLLSKESWKELFQERMTTPAKDFESSFLRKDGRSVPVLVNATNIEFEGIAYNCSYVNDITALKRVENKLQEAYDEIATSEEELRLRTEELNTLNENLVSQKNELEKTILKLREAQDQLVQAEKMASLGVLVAGIAHELNNPINYLSTGGEGLKIVLEDVLIVVNKYSEITPDNIEDKLQEINILREELDYEELLTDMSKMVENINMGAVQATDIIKGLKSFSRMDTGSLQLYNIHNGIDNVFLMLYNTFKHRVKVVKRYGVIPEISCYPSKLGQVFMNLITNAVQSIEGEGSVEIRTYMEHEFAVIEVKDDGTGISPEIEKRVFEPFFTTKDTGQGTGLGLAISLGIIEDHMGRIEFFNNEEGGATFRVYLPLARD